MSTPGNDIRGYFDAAAAGRDALILSDPVLAYEQRRRATALMALLEPRRGQRILDVGCGNGRDLPPLLEAGCICTAIDCSPEMIAEARKRLPPPHAALCELLVADATRLPFDDGEFDAVFSSEVIEHIPDWQAAVAEMARVLRAGGRLVLTTPNRRSWYGLDRYVLFEGLLGRPWKHPFDRWKTFDEVSRAVRAAGLRLRRVLGACYLPGFILSYALPTPMKRALVRVVERYENTTAQLAPRSGYMLAICAVKPAR